MTSSFWTSVEYYKKVIKILKKVGFIGGNVVSCLYMKKSAKGLG